MKYVIATIDKPRYLWEMLVQINNFRKMGIEKDTHYIVSCFRGIPSDELMRIMESEDLECNITAYNDTRVVGRRYSSTLRLDGLRNHFKYNPDLQKEVFMYLDPDVIFTKPFDFSHLEKGTEWYVSNTKSYIGANYIKSKSTQLFHEMCEIVGISPELVEKNEMNSGGAQYIMKNVSSAFWDKCENDSENLYRHMVETASKYHPEHPIQAWTADMWAVLWNGWLQTEVKVVKELDFCWASDNIKRYNDVYIFHNAGIVGDGKVERIIDGKKEVEYFFSKLLYNDSTPFNKNIKVDDTNASYMYLQEIKETERVFRELIF